MCSSTACLLGPYKLKLLRAIYKLISIRLRYDPSLIGLLHEVLISLLVCKPDRILFRFETYPLALHKVAGGLPAYQRILPSMSFGQWIPVHEPLHAVPVTRLRRSLRWLVYSRERLENNRDLGEGVTFVPDCPRLKIDWCSRENCSGHRFAWLTAVHHSLRDR